MANTLPSAQDDTGLQTAAEFQQHACSHSGTDHAGHVGAHCLHEQEVLAVVFQT